jgi:signal transduction histidine kinase
MVLHEALAAQSNEVLLRWKAQVAGTVAPETMPPLELVNHIPKFLREIVAALRADAGLSSFGPSPEESMTAAGHGAQRLRLGFSLDSVVREYGALRAAIISTALDNGVQPTLRELEVLFDAIVTGIALAVTEYSNQRDAELLRQTNEHFAFIAHELRDPLSSAATAFLLLKRAGQLPLQNRIVDALDRGLQRTSELINQTLQVARVASGIELRRQSTTLKALFEEAELGASSEAESKSITLRVVIEKDERIDIDVRLVRSALGNLLQNAVKYTTPGGLVELRGRVASGRFVIEVEDCCGGLDPGKVERAFAPFVRLDNREPGFGLGLAIAKQAVDAHGGTIRVQNLPGKGCIFVLEIPISTEG